MNMPLFIYQSPLTEHPGCFQSFALPSEKGRCHSALSSDDETCREWVQSDPNLESPFACFSFEQLDRPLESAQLFFLPWIKTI